MPSSDIYDLDVIDQAFGRDADLYNDVLRVSYLASDGEIQSAFFDRRSELFAVLSKLSEEESDDDEILLSQRRFAERRMDAVVVCFRILKDPELRAIYEGERERRLSHRTTIQNPAKQSPTAVQSFDQDAGPERKARRDRNEEPLRDDSPSRGSSRDSDGQSHREVFLHSDAPPPRTTAKVSKRERIVQESTPPRMSANNKPELVVIDVTPPRKKEKQKVSRSHDTEITQSETLSDDESSRRAPPVVQQQQRGRRSRREPPQDPIIDDEYDNQSLTSTTSKPASVFESIKESKVVRTITEEVHGAYVDTVSAFDQVLNAFTLNESDITAVVGRIDKAKKQFRAPAPNQRE